ncbi:LOW QUALITY PROTEIN: tumor necrosis factor receptor superfamily member 6 [Ctenodactylus gundi]
MQAQLALIFIVGSLSRSVNARVTDINSRGSELKNVTKREVQCSKGQYPADQVCCQLCPPGTWKKADCKTDNGEPHCVSCREGEEYTDKAHYSPKCRKCKFCDGGHGLEVETNCTQTRNTKCKCKSNFYCSTSVCEHCNPCTTCEHGIIEECTLTSNTKCKKESNIPPPPIPTIKYEFQISLVVVVQPPSTDSNSCGEMSFHTILYFSDVDLSKYIISIAEQMTLNQVKEFVRKNGMAEAKIDDIKNDHPQDTAEQKIQLLRNWYLALGKKDAYRTLMKSLREASLCGVAEKIHNIIQTDMSKDLESNVRNENERQSLT